MQRTELTSVVRVLAKLEPGGAQLSALRVIVGLRSLGIESRLLVGWASPEGLALAERMGVEVEIYGGAPGMQWHADRHFAAWLRPRLAGAAVVHAHMFGAWWAAARAVDEGTVLVASEHNALSWPLGRAPASLRPGLARVDRFYAHGPGARASMLRGGLRRSRLFDGASPIIDLDVSPDSALPTPRLVFAGRLHADKGADVLVEALALLPDAPPAYLLGDGPLAPQLAERIASHGMQSRVQLAGWQNRPATFLAGATVAVIPSREESWSQAAVLAMALGVPVIGTDVDGLPTTLGNARGLVVPSEDPRALAAAIDDIVRGRKQTDLVGARAYAEGFTVAQVSATYAAAYRELHAGRPAGATPLTTKAP